MALVTIRAMRRIKDDSGRNEFITLSKYVVESFIWTLTAPATKPSQPALSQRVVHIVDGYMA